ncbi:unnamed protein product [Urochloa humidicola]
MSQANHVKQSISRKLYRRTHQHVLYAPQPWEQESMTEHQSHRSHSGWLNRAPLLFALTESSSSAKLQKYYR